MNRDEREIKAIVDVKEESTGDTDDSQEEGIDRFDKKIGADSSNVIHHTTRRPSKRISGTSLKPSSKEQYYWQFDGVGDFLSAITMGQSSSLAKSKDIIDPPSPVIAVVRPAAFKVWMSSFFW